ncbi:MAG TPA: O-antigen ligase family protein [Terriglobia bacterium]
MNRVLEVVLAVVLVGTVLNFGGVKPLAYSLMELVLFAALLALLIRATWQGRPQLRVSIWPLLFAAWTGLQLVPLPAGLVRWLQPARFQGPPANLVTPGWLTVSIYPHATLLLWVRFLAYLAAFILAINLFDSRSRSSLLVRTLMGIGLLEAVYGSVEYLTGWEQIFTYNKQYYTGMATGTYINHNHFAGALELTLPFLAGSVFYYFRLWQENRRKAFSRPAQAGAPAGFQAIVYIFLLIVMLVALVLSQSRGGILGALVSLLFIALLAQLRVRRKSWLLGLLVFTLVAVGYGLWIGLGDVLQRFQTLSHGTQDYDIATRLAFSRDALGMIRDYPWTGSGLGTFVVAFRHYQANFTTLFIEHPHNDYVEFAAEAGVVGAALLFLPIAYLLIKMIATFLSDPRRYRPSVLLGCVGSVLAILVHSVMDFNLQIPANALILAVVLGIGYKAACVERREEGTERSRSGQAVRTVVRRH